MEMWDLLEKGNASIWWIVAAWDVAQEKLGYFYCIIILYCFVYKFRCVVSCTSTSVCIFTGIHRWATRKTVPPWPVAVEFWWEMSSYHFRNISIFSLIGSTKASHQVHSVGSFCLLLFGSFFFFNVLHSFSTVLVDSKTFSGVTLGIVNFSLLMWTQFKMCVSFFSNKQLY